MFQIDCFFVQGADGMYAVFVRAPMHKELERALKFRVVFCDAVYTTPTPRGVEFSLFGGAREVTRRGYAVAVVTESELSEILDFVRFMAQFNSK